MGPYIIWNIKDLKNSWQGTYSSNFNLADYKVFVYLHAFRIILILYVYLYNFRSLISHTISCVSLAISHIPVLKYWKNLLAKCIYDIKFKIFVFFFFFQGIFGKITAQITRKSRLSIILLQKRVEKFFKNLFT